MSTHDARTHYHTFGIVTKKKDEAQQAPVLQFVA